MVEGQGNFGSIDGDPPAAMRYTEARMTRLAEEMLVDIDKNTVDFQTNYDDSLNEPMVMPSKVPFLLINGSTGIAVGMATNMAPHNLGEVGDAIVAVIDNPELGLEEIIKLIPGPDFPTGGIIYGRAGIWEAYKTGAGRITVRARAAIERTGGDREAIVVTEIPYMVNKSSLLERIGDLIRDKIVEGISFLRDESDRHGMRIVVGLKKDAMAEVVLNNLYKYTSLQSTFGINNLALVNKRPLQLSMKQLIDEFIKHRHEVVVRRTEFDLKKAEERAHILQGLKIAIDAIDRIVELIKKSDSAEIARENLQSEFGLSEVQAKAILDMRLQRLTGLEREKIDIELAELEKKIVELKEILADSCKRMQIIKDEMIDLKKRFADARKTDIVDDSAEVEIEDMIADEDMVITMSHAGYIKRCPVSMYRSQGRGGRGVKGMDSKEEDFVETIFVASAHSYIIFFTDRGRCHWLKVYRIPEAGRHSRGRPIVNLLDIRPDDKVASFSPIREFDDRHFIIIATEKGIVNKQLLSAYANIRKGGINALVLDEGDRVIEIKLTDGNNEIILGTKFGQAVRFQESMVREQGRNTRGVRGIKLRENDSVVGMIVVDESNLVLSVTENGYGKRTSVKDYRKTNRGGSGIINIICSERNGNVVGMKRVSEGQKQDLMLITRNGIIIRSDVDTISIIGRNAQGVKLINLEEGDKLIDLAICDREENGMVEGQEKEPEQPSQDGAYDSQKPPHGAEDMNGTAAGDPIPSSPADID
jgi:DNA gyrase subunit A